MGDGLPVLANTIRIETAGVRPGLALCTELDRLGLDAELVYSERGWEVEIAAARDRLTATID